MSVLIIRTKEKPPYAYQLKYDGKTIYIRLLDSHLSPLCPLYVPFVPFMSPLCPLWKTIYIRLLDSETYRTKMEFEVYRSKEDKKIYLIEREFLDKTSVKERKYFYKGERIPSVENADPFELFNLISGKKGKLIESRTLNGT